MNRSWISYKVLKAFRGMLYVIGPLALLSCSEDGTKDGFNDYDQRLLLDNIGNNLIVPGYALLAEESTTLVSATEGFIANPTLSTLSGLREQLKKIRLAWQSLTPYQFGPAETQGLTAALNIYPVDVNQIENNIQEGTYDLSTLANNDAKGFQAIGYLLYRDEMSDEEILDSFIESRASYLLNVVNYMDERVQSVNTTWENEYLIEFTSEDALGVDVGSSLGQLVNAMNRDFERNTRDGKVGIPVGVRTLGEPYPKASEAYYAGYSIELLAANIEAYERLFRGADGEGLDDYLQALSVVSDNETLSEEILSQFEVIKQAVGQLNDPLQAEIETSKADVETVFVEMQTLVVLFKTEMASALGVTITYQDNDGD